MYVGECSQVEQPLLQPARPSVLMAIVGGGGSGLLPACQGVNDLLNRQLAALVSVACGGPCTQHLTVKRYHMMPQDASEVHQRSIIEHHTCITSPLLDGAQ